MTKLHKRLLSTFVLAAPLLALMAWHNFVALLVTTCIALAVFGVARLAWFWTERMGDE